VPKKTTKKTSTKAEEAVNFESALSELETLVECMEKGELSLEQALTDFQRGIELSRQCQQALNAAEKQVQILITQGEEDKLAPFDVEE